MEVRVGKRRTMVIPKRIAEKLGIEEGSRLEVEVKDNCLVLKPVKDAVWLSIHGKKLLIISLRELEAESIYEQEKYIKGSD